MCWQTFEAVVVKKLDFSKAVACRCVDSLYLNLYKICHDVSETLYVPDCIGQIRRTLVFGQFNLGLVEIV